MSVVNANSTGSPANVNSPTNLDDEETRRKALEAGLGTDDDESSEEDTNTTPIPEKNKRTNRAVNSRFKKTPVTQTVPPPADTQIAGKVVNKSDGGYNVEGTNIGSKASEPDWTPEQLQQIANACDTVMRTSKVPDTRRSQQDKDGKFLTIGVNDSVVTKPAGMLPNVGFTQYALGLGLPKADEKTGKSRAYIDIVMKGEGWMLNQWTSMGVIMESVPSNILNKPPRMTGGKPERRIGHHFVRLGLPKLSFGPIFNTLRATFPSILEGVSQVRGLYWLNASWGVTGSPAKFIYRDSNKQIRNTYELSEAMRAIRNNSSMGIATIAISVGSETRIVNGKAEPDPGKYELSIKIHNMLNIEECTHHSPPQSASTGFEVSNDILDMMKPLETNQSEMGSAFNATSSAFAGGSMNPFFNANMSVTDSAISGQGSNNLL